MAAVGRPWVLLALLAAPLAFHTARPVLQGARGRALVPAIGRTGLYQLGFSTLLTIGLVLSA